MKQSPTYPKHNPWELEPDYSRHVSAMTFEGLHSKADIAEQLAWRDRRIAELETQLAAAELEAQLAAAREEALREALEAIRAEADPCVSAAREAAGRGDQTARVWLRDRSRVLRQAAYGAEHAYSPESDLGRVCARVASAYRKAAALLDDEATTANG